MSNRYKHFGVTAANRQRGYAVWVILLVLVAAVLGAWRFSEYRAAQKLLAKETAEKQAQQTRAEQERQALEDRLAKEKAQRDSLTMALKAFDDVVLRWNDAVKVAGTTSRISLSGPVATLQAIRRDAEKITAPPCLDAGKVELLKSMSSTEQGFLVFMRNELKLGDVLSKGDFEDAEKAMVAFKLARESCPTASP